MMLSDEPYRWAEGVANRRDYIEDQIRTGSPVVGMGYEDGILMLTLSRSQQKLFEVYGRIGRGRTFHRHREIAPGGHRYGTLDRI